MIDLLFLLVIAATFTLLISGLLRRGGYTEYPFLAAVVYAGWFLPQAVALRKEAFLPEFGLALVLGMALLCLGAIVLGWRLGRAKRPKGRPIYVDLNRAFWPIVGVTAFATLMQYLIQIQPAEARAMAQWTGTLTIIAFFSQVGLVSLSFSFLLYFYKKNAKTLALLGWNLALYAPAVLIYFRRAETGELLLALVAALWFARRITIPRPLILGGLILGFLFVHAVGQLRALSGGYALDDSGQITTRIPSLEEISKIDIFGVTPLSDGSGNFEVRNAVYYMSSIESRSDLTLGTGLWNKLVFSYIPGQIVGFELKHSLITGDSVSKIALVEAGYETHTGTTSTGFVSAYREFWFFGAFIFLATGYCMGRAYSLALMGSQFGQVLYMSTMMIALHTITHFSYYYIVNLPIVLVGILTVLAVARSSPRSRIRSLNSQATHVRTQGVHKVAP